MRLIEFFLPERGKIVSLHTLKDNFVMISRKKLSIMTLRKTNRFKALSCGGNQEL